MTGTVSKSIEDIVKALGGAKKVMIVGCASCSTTFHTGGEPEVKEMTRVLSERGFEVVAAGLPTVKTCGVDNVADFFFVNGDALAQADAVLVLSCGEGAQIVRQCTEEEGLTIPVLSGTDTVGHMGTQVSPVENPVGEFMEQCAECGECLLNSTGGICPVTRCAKGLLNGPCGGAKNGKCEVDPDRDCAWVLIYNRLKALNSLDNMKEIREAKHYSKAAHPRRVRYTRETGPTVV